MPIVNSQLLVTVGLFLMINCSLSIAGESLLHISQQVTYSYLHLQCRPTAVC